MQFAEAAPAARGSAQATFRSRSPGRARCGPPRCRRGGRSRASARKGEARRDRIAFHRLGRAEQAGIVHGDHAGAVPRRDMRPCPGSPCSPRTSLTMMRAGADRRLRDRRLHRVDRDERADVAQRLDDRQNAAASPPPLRPASHSPRVDSPPTSRMCGALRRSSFRPCAIAASAIEEEPAVGEGIGRDVDDAHDGRRARPLAIPPRPKQVRETVANMGGGVLSGGAEARNPHQRLLEQGVPADNRSGRSAAEGRRRL